MYVTRACSSTELRSGKHGFSLGRSASHHTGKRETVRNNFFLSEKLPLTTRIMSHTPVIPALWFHTETGTLSEVLTYYRNIF